MSIWVLAATFTAAMILALLVLAIAMLVAWAKAHAHAQQELDDIVSAIRFPAPIPTQTLLAKAREAKQLRSRVDRLSYILGIDLNRYFQARQHEGAFDERLREAGIDPEALDIPPPIEELGANELLDPQAQAADINEDFFARQD